MVDQIPYDFENIAIIQYINTFLEKDVESLLYVSKPLDRLGTREKIHILDDIYRVMTMPSKHEIDFLLHIEQDPVVRRHIKKIKTDWENQHTIHQNMYDHFTKWLHSNSHASHYDFDALDSIL